MALLVLPLFFCPNLVCAAANGGPDTQTPDPTTLLTGRLVRSVPAVGRIRTTGKSCRPSVAGGQGLPHGAWHMASSEDEAARIKDRLVGRKDALLGAMREKLATLNGLRPQIDSLFGQLSALEGEVATSSRRMAGLETKLLALDADTMASISRLETAIAVYRQGTSMAGIEEARQQAQTAERLAASLCALAEKAPLDEDASSRLSQLAERLRKESRIAGPADPLNEELGRAGIDDWLADVQRFGARLAAIRQEYASANKAIAERLAVMKAGAQRLGPWLDQARALRDQLLGSAARLAVFPELGPEAAAIAAQAKAPLPAGDPAAMVSRASAKVPHLERLFQLTETRVQSLQRGAKAEKWPRNRVAFESAAATAQAALARGQACYRQALARTNAHRAAAADAEADKDHGFAEVPGTGQSRLSPEERDLARQQRSGNEAADAEARSGQSDSRKKSKCRRLAEAIMAAADAGNEAAVRSALPRARRCGYGDKVAAWLDARQRQREQNASGQQAALDGRYAGTYRGGATGNIRFTIRGDTLRGAVTGRYDGDGLSGSIDGRVDGAGVIRATLSGNVFFQGKGYPFRGRLTGRVNGRGAAGNWSAANQSGRTNAQGDWNAGR